MSTKQAKDIKIGDKINTDAGVKIVLSISKGMIKGRVSINFKDKSWSEVTPTTIIEVLP